MKRTVAGVLLVMALGAGTMFADDGWRGRDIRRDEARIAYERRELRREYRDLRNDRYWGR